MGGSPLTDYFQTADPLKAEPSEVVVVEAEDRVDAANNQNESYKNTLFMNDPRNQACRQGL